MDTGMILSSGPLDRKNASIPVITVTLSTNTPGMASVQISNTPQHSLGYDVLKTEYILPKTYSLRKKGTKAITGGTFWKGKHMYC